MSETRSLTWCRLLVGAGFMYQSVAAHVLGMHEARALFEAHTAWQSWPLVAGFRPLELTLWLAFAEFFLGVFIFGGLFTRPLALVGAVVAAFQALTLGLAGGVVAPLLALGSLVIGARGGGTGTMEAVLGKMQRRSIERQRERDEERRRAREAKRHSADALASEHASPAKGLEGAGEAAAR